MVFFRFWQISGVISGDWIKWILCFQHRRETNQHVFSIGIFIRVDWWVIDGFLLLYYLINLDYEIRITHTQPGSDKVWLTVRYGSHGPVENKWIYPYLFTWWFYPQWCKRLPGGSGESLWKTNSQRRCARDQILGYDECWRDITGHGWYGPAKSCTKFGWLPCK